MPVAVDGRRGPGGGQRVTAHLSVEGPTKMNNVSLTEVESLRQEVMKEVSREEENLSLIERHPQRARRLVPLLVGVVVLNLILVVIIPNYGLYWIVAGFLVYMYYFIVLLFPTTRRVRSPADKKEGRKAGPRLRRKRQLRAVVTRGKKAVVIAFWNSFFIGTQTLARGIDLIMIISIAFVVLGLGLGTVDLFPASVIIIQAIAIMSYYQIIIHYRPYSKDFLRTVRRVRRDKSVQFRWQAYLKGVLIVLILATVFAVFIVSAILLPKRSLDLFVASLDAAFGLTILGLIVIFASHFIIVRYLQGFDSARITTRFINDKLHFLRSEILGGLDRLEGEAVDGDRQASFQALKRKFEISRIYRIAYKDMFGILPTYPIIVDFVAIFEKDVADALGEEIPLDVMI